jgi:AraC-like DNA-binding protein
MILTELPDLPPAPETRYNKAFREAFYSQWGKGNWIVCGWAHRAEYSRLRQTLSFKTVNEGVERYFVDGRQITVTDNTYLVLNEGREYSSLLESPRRAFSFSIFVRPGLAAEVAHAAPQSLATALDHGPVVGSARVEFSENLRPHDHRVTPVLRYIRYYVEAGERDEAWFEEQYLFLVARLLAEERARPRLVERLNQARPATRHELERRVGWAVDFMLSNMHRDLALSDLAEAARLSTYHFAHVFQQAHGLTPMVYLRRARLERALALLEARELPVNEVAARVGLSRLALWRGVRRLRGVAPREVGDLRDHCGRDGDAGRGTDQVLRLAKFDQSTGSRTRA